MNGITWRQQAILNAIEDGYTTLRAIMARAGVSSTSVVKYNLELLAQRGMVALDVSGAVYDGADFCAAWDAAARLAGNVEA